LTGSSQLWGLVEFGFPIANSTASQPILQSRVLEKDKLVANQLPQVCSLMFRRYQQNFMSVLLMESVAKNYQCKHLSNA